MERIQKSTATLFNRYAEVFIALRDFIRTLHGRDLGGADLRILSFGCSNGSEMLTARAYFPDATILGCDIDQEALNAAALTLWDDEGELFLSSPETIRTFAPYDIILANSVLCLYPLSESVTNLKSHFPFSKFEDLSNLLIDVLAPDGFFTLHNANYRFADLQGAAEFQSLLAPQIEGNGFVAKFAPDGTRLSRSTLYRGQRTYSHQVLSSGITDSDFRDCLFYRGDKLKSRQSKFNSVGDKAQHILGLDPHQMDEDIVAAGLFSETLENGIRRKEWCKSSVGGSIIRLGSWEIKASNPPLRSTHFLDKAKGHIKKTGFKRWFS